jgi:hypothetical protein
VNTFSCYAQKSAEACTSHSICEWRVGCASACQRALATDECPANCGVIGVDRACYGLGCRAPDSGAQNANEDQCAALPGCNWQDACWEARDTACHPNLNESECKRRNCSWNELGSQL